MPQPLVNLPGRLTAAQAVAAKITSNNTQVVRLVADSFDSVWKGRQGVTAQEVLDAFGPNAANLLAAFELIKQAMSLVGVPTPALPDGVTITPNQDGTVKVSTK